MGGCQYMKWIQAELHWSFLQEIKKPSVFITKSSR